MNELIASVQHQLTIPLADAQTLYRALGATGVYDELVVNSKWTPERFQAWLADTLTTQLLTARD